MKKLIFLALSLSALTIFAADNYVGIDVRSGIERKINPADGSIAISNDDLASDIKKHVPNKETKIKVFCEVGGRASRSKQILEKLGYKNVENIKSWRDWNKLKGND
jgi:phage shock protein E